MPGDVTQLLNDIEAGDSSAAEELLPLVYRELRHLAAVRMADEKPGQTLQATALVHEAWLRIAGDGQQHFSGRRHFFKSAAQAMQRILIDVARRKQSLKHGAGVIPEELLESRIEVKAESDELLALHEALELLEKENPQAVEIVRLRYFVGLSIPDIANVLEMAPRTVDRQWAYARAWLKRSIRGAVSGIT